jgi:hypothetical protein
MKLIERLAIGPYPSTPPRQGVSTRETIEIVLPSAGSAAELTSGVVFLLLESFPAGPGLPYLRERIVGHMVETLTQDPVLPVDERLDKALRWANAQIHQRARSSNQSSAVGASALLAALTESRQGLSLELAYVGGCYAYLIRAGQLIVLTVDHAKTYAAGTPSADHGLARYLGAEDGVNVDHAIIAPNVNSEGYSRHLRYSLQPTDRLVLCTASLPPQVVKEQINLIARRDVQTTAQQLVRNARRPGAMAIVIDPQPPPLIRRSGWGCLWSRAGLLLLLALLLISAYWFLPQCRNSITSRTGDLRQICVDEAVKLPEDAATWLVEIFATPSPTVPATETPIVVETSTLTPTLTLTTPVSTSLLTPTVSVVPSATVTESLTQTPRPAATPTSAPTPTPTRLALAPPLPTTTNTATRMPTATPTFTVTATPEVGLTMTATVEIPALPPSTPTSVLPGSTATVTTTVVISQLAFYPLSESWDANSRPCFTWQATGSLPPDQAFQVQIWHPTKDQPMGAHEANDSPRLPSVGNQYEFCFKPTGARSVEEHGNGDYFWTVSVVRISPSYEVITPGPPQRIKIQVTTDSGDQRESPGQAPLRTSGTSGTS